MKRTGNLFAAFTAFPNLLNAYYKARKGTRRNQETGFFFLNLEAELFQLQEELLQLTYQPQPYRYFQIYDPKERTISVAAFRDRVVHHALVNVLEPVYERIFIYDSYATRKGKGNHLALLRAQQMIRIHPLFLKSDVDKYFDSISQERLMEIIAHKIKDAQLLDITARIIRNGGHRGLGLPIGNLTSQFFANVYLNELDYFVKHQLKGKYYIRYMDDFVLFEPDRRTLKSHLTAIQYFLADSLQLQLKPSATFINSSANGLTFLGKRIFPQAIRIARPNLLRMTRKMKNREEEYKEGTISEEDFLASMNSYWACLAFGDTYGLRKKLASS
ncbi:reverse transcriptase/maturase family protein [Haliscomenobacter hydrossis]|uniref:RNA-directed DNA polymerase (Reverse transcriptase) n=1 Tax=Haliscomenobacter hydrossis (strain ATCC 27775 / DSM 1100 / LMG 10767 / O) TaxID=760192 RepID=F4KPS9_HALH1|nr:reverse transcriptase/maturase family protein [Haliscomenobacter hydrossis]AEE52179.1 RNA-directed DNA polymerase (Reverse transcriptase) [Haliscomenobacter hydrossis DSM 1100]